MATSWLEPVCVLKLPAKPKISQEDHKNQLAFDLGSRIEEPNERQAQKEERKRRFVPSAIVHSTERPERGHEVWLQKVDHCKVFRAHQIFQEHLGSLQRDPVSEGSYFLRSISADLFKALSPGSKREVAKALRSFKWWYLFDPVVKSLQQRYHSGGPLDSSEIYPWKTIPSPTSAGSSGDQGR
jgi:hypothetical protein